MFLSTLVIVCLLILLFVSSFANKESLQILLRNIGMILNLFFFALFHCGVYLELFIAFSWSCLGAITVLLQKVGIKERRGKDLQ